MILPLILRSLGGYLVGNFVVAAIFSEGHPGVFLAVFFGINIFAFPTYCILLALALLLRRYVFWWPAAFSIALPLLGIVASHFLHPSNLFAISDAEYLLEHGVDKKIAFVVLLHAVPAALTFYFMMKRGARLSAE